MCSLLSISSSTSAVYISVFSCFFFNDTATTEIYTLSLHDALPISYAIQLTPDFEMAEYERKNMIYERSEEHTSELQSQFHLVCRLLLEKKKQRPIHD